MAIGGLLTNHWNGAFYNGYSKSSAKGENGALKWLADAAPRGMKLEKDGENIENQTAVKSKAPLSYSRCITTNIRTEELTADFLDKRASMSEPVSEERIALLFEDRDVTENAGSEIKKTAREYREQAFDQIGINAPESVKQAWLDAADVAGIDGMGVSEDGKLSHITQFMVQRVLRKFRGENEYDLLGSSVESAIKATRNALYALEHPLEPNRAKTPEQIRNREKEKIFYQEFINRLQCL